MAGKKFFFEADVLRRFQTEHEQLLKTQHTITENERETEVQKLKNRDNDNSERKKLIREAVKEQQERQTEGGRRLVPCLQIKAGGQQQP